MSDVICPMCDGQEVCFEVGCGACDGTGLPNVFDDPLGCCEVCFGLGSHLEDCDLCFGSGVVSEQVHAEFEFELIAGKPGSEL